MPLETIFITAEREKLAVLVNNLCIFAAQLVQRNVPGFATRALTNLVITKTEHKSLLKRVDALASESGDESPSRLIEDLAQRPTDTAEMLTTIRRCLAASAFLAHCIAQPTQKQSTSAEMVASAARLH